MQGCNLIHESVRDYLIYVIWFMSLLFHMNFFLNTHGFCTMDKKQVSFLLFSGIIVVFPFLYLKFGLRNKAGFNCVIILSAGIIGMSHHKLSLPSFVCNLLGTRFCSLHVVKLVIYAESRTS